MLRAIREISPRWVVGENVFGLVNWSGGLVFDEVQTDLETAGYEVFPYVLPAVSVNAPHRRDRIWFVAYSKLCPNRLPTTGGVDMERTILEGREWREKADGFGIVGTDGNAADTEGEPGKRVRSKFGESCEQEQEQFGGNCSEVGCERNATNTQRKRYEWLHKAGYKIDINGESAKIWGGFTGHDKKNDWANFPTVSPICVRDDGISDRLDGITFPKWRNESIKAAGNAICPQLVHQIFKAIEQYEQLP